MPLKILFSFKLAIFLRRHVPQCRMRVQRVVFGHGGRKTCHGTFGLAQVNKGEVIALERLHKTLGHAV